MKPYYEQDGITIYHGDCREILPKISGNAAIVTDPPYGLGDKWSGGTWGSAQMYRDAREWDNLVPELQTLLDGRTAIVWGGQLYGLPATRCWLAWFKRQALRTMADFELAWTTLDRPSKAWSGLRNQERAPFHPCEKPIGLMRWCLGFVDGDVFDPFAGSGTTLVAAKETGRRAIGIEIEERYCEVAARRLSQACLPYHDSAAADSDAQKVMFP